MSYFSKFVSHPALAALAGLLSHPAIAANPDAVAAINEAQTAGTVIASTATAAAAQVAATAQSEADPILSALGHGAQAIVDAYLLSTLGPIGTAAVPVANAVIAMGEDKLHALIAALFTHAKVAHADVVANSPTNTIPVAA